MTKTHRKQRSGMATLVRGTPMLGAMMGMFGALPAGWPSLLQPRPTDSVDPTPEPVRISKASSRALIRAANKRLSRRNKRLRNVHRGGFHHFEEILLW